MALTHLVTFRLPVEKYFLYETEARYRGQSLGVYLRERLEKSDAPSPDLHALCELLGTVTPSSSHDQGVLLEILLLLRCLASPEKMLLVQRELSRLNIPIWQGDHFSEKPKHAT